MQTAKKFASNVKPDTQIEMINAGIKAYTRICERWKLKNTTAARLLDVEIRTWNRMKTGNWRGTLTQDQILRLSAFVGLYKGLHLYFSDSLADKWPTLANSGPPIHGDAPVDYISKGGLPALLATKNYIDAACEGL